ncbi:MAG: hypothetical protein ACLGQW_08740 [Acidobacteriota bacterium]
MMSDEERAQAFLGKWSSTMHWVYDDMAQAADTWRRHGIKGLPPSTPGAQALLEPCVRRDAQFHARLREMAQ